MEWLPPTDCYTALKEEPDEWYQMNMLDRWRITRPVLPRHCVEGIAQFYIESIDARRKEGRELMGPSLELKIAGLLRDANYSPPSFRSWMLEELARDADVDNRCRAWIYVQNAGWSVPREDLVAAVDREGDDVGYSLGRKLALDSIGRIGRREYPQESWWHGLIQDAYGK